MAGVYFHLDPRNKMETKSILMRIIHKDTQCVRATGLKIKEHHWDRDNKTPVPFRSEYEKLFAIKKEIKEVVFPNLVEGGNEFTAKDLANAYNAFKKGIEDLEEDRVITDLITKLVRERSGVLSPSRINQYERTSSLIIKSGLENDYAEMGRSWILRFVDFLIQEEMINSTIKQYIKAIIAVFEWYELDTRFRMKDIKSLRTGGSKKEPKPYLQLDTLTEFWEATHQLKDIEFDVRNLFMFSCLTGLRHNELMMLTHRNLIHLKEYTILTYTTSKNDGKTIEVPLCGKALEIIDMYTRHRSLLPVVSDSKCNEVLRDILRDFGLTELRQKVRYSGTKRIEQSMHLYELISFHSSRRSYCSNLMNNGLSVQETSDLTGVGTVTLLSWYSESDGRSRNEKALEILSRI